MNYFGQIGDDSPASLSSGQREQFSQFTVELKNAVARTDCSKIISRPDVATGSSEQPLTAEPFACGQRLLRLILDLRREEHS